EPVVALIVGNIASNGVAARIFHEHDGRINRRFRFIRDDTVHGSQLGFVLGIFAVLSGNDGRKEKRQTQAEAEKTHSVIHFFPPAGSIRKTTLSSLMPLRASTV